MRVCRAMIESDDGTPLICGGNPKRCLRVKVGEIAQNEDGSVEPGQEGMSVSPRPPENLPRARRPVQLGGGGKDPVWELETDDLPDELVYRPDPNFPETHFFIEPAYQMTFEHYQQAIASTSVSWSLV